MLSLAELRADPEVEPVFLAPEPAPEYLRELALGKRFCERYRGDGAFREALARAPEAALAEAGLPLEPEQVRALHDSDGPPSRVARRVWAWLQEKVVWRNGLREQMRLAAPGLDAWRRRQIRRCASQLPTGNAEVIIHPPAAFELSRGCSVGCWFCGVSAPRLSDLWPATAENRALWRGVLEAVGEVCGPAAAQAFLYWATDPLDNPDYEQFCLDFQAVLGAFPQTTTALALKNPERTRRLLALAQTHGCPVNRFSVLTLKQLLRIHELFSAEELLRVELVLQNKEALGEPSAAGKALSRAAAQPAHATTIACVSGFLFSMPERRVRLVSPCPASPRWPDGYIIHAEASFADLAEVRSLLSQFAARPERLGLDDVPRLREDLAWSALPGGFRLGEVVFHDRHYPAMARLGELLAEGRLSVEELAARAGAEPAETILALQQMFAGAFFAE